jgi:hypothetical protein
LHRFRELTFRIRLCRGSPAGAVFLGKADQPIQFDGLSIVRDRAT